MLHVAHQARLDKVGKDGATRRAYLEAAALNGNRTAIEALERHPPSIALSYLHGWALDLVGRSGVGQFGLAPLSFTTIRHWADLKDIDVLPHEVDALIVLDGAMRDPGEEETAKDDVVVAPTWPVRRAEPILIPSAD